MEDLRPLHHIQDSAKPLCNDIRSRHQPLTQILCRCRIPCGYGMIICTALGSVMLITWQALNVSKARKRYKIPLPACFTNDEDNAAFNCAVRPFYNTMQHIPQFLFFLFIGGLSMPYFSSIGGLIWLVGRVDNSVAHYNRDPSRRNRGAYGIWGMILLMIATGRFAITCWRF